MSEAIGYYSDDRTWKDKIRGFLGFGTAGRPNVDDLDNDPMFCESHLITESVICFDFLDRLRILMTGKVNHVTVIKTDVPVRYTASRSNVSVMGWGQ
jgi:hypothetical protein